ncbi:hypothetical protein JCM10450v2_003287 [Rhodotorula kratochvilovae]
MSSYLNKLPPPPPPPRAAPGAVPTSSDPSASTPASLGPPAPRKGHKSAGSLSGHYNDAPDLDIVRQPSQKRSRATSRVAASLRPSPPPSNGASTATSSSVGSSTPAVQTADTILPAFTAPPPPPPEPTLNRRYGPLPGDFYHPADVLSFDQIDPSLPTKLILLFIPGNPGLVGFYRSFLASLRNSLPADLRSQTKVYAVGHLRHTPDFKEDRGFNPQHLPSLQDQVTDKVTFVELLAQTDKLGTRDGPKLVVLGHSIGAWVGLQMLKERPQYISAVHALFPTISRMAETPNGRRLSPLFSSWALRPVFYSTSALSYLPTSLATRLVSLLTGQSGAGAETTAKLVSSPETVVAALTTAREELARVTDLDAALLEQYGDRVWFYWAAEGVDGWVTEEAVREIEGVLERKFGEEGRRRRQRCIEGMPHAFVLDEAHSTSLARKCAGWIVEDLAAAAVEELAQEGDAKDTA